MPKSEQFSISFWHSTPCLHPQTSKYIFIKDSNRSEPKKACSNCEMLPSSDKNTRRCESKPADMADYTFRLITASRDKEQVDMHTYISRLQNYAQDRFVLEVVQPSNLISSWWNCLQNPKWTSTDQSWSTHQYPLLKLQGYQCNFYANEISPKYWMWPSQYYL